MVTHVNHMQMSTELPAFHWAPGFRARAAEHPALVTVLDDHTPRHQMPRSCLPGSPASLSSTGAQP